jgi:hypothetical protein
MSKAKLWESVIYLEPIQHKYHHRETGKTYKSVTTTLTSIEPHFDSESVSAAIANQADNAKQERYIGLTQQEILDFWQQLNDDANIYGSKVHDIVERYLLANKWYFTDDTEDGLFEQKVIEGYNALNIDEGIAMWPERILFAEQYELAGMSDLIIDHENNFFSVIDWKTNRDFGYWNYFGYQTLHPPFDHYQSCQYSVYSLQLSVYARMYELETGRKCRDIMIGYWDKEKMNFTKIPVMYLKHDAQKLIEMHHYNLMKNA